VNRIYNIFGLNILSAIPLPAPFSDPPPNLAPDVVIEYGNTPTYLTNPQSKGVRYQAAPGEFLLQVDSVARYYVSKGRHITIAPEPDADDEEILVFLMGSAMGALLLQRNILVLHAGAIAVNGQGVIFSGHSGIGKSTLTAGFHQRGYSFLADDVCAIAMVNGKPAVVPGFPQLKLWADVLKKLNTNKDLLKSVRWTRGLEKYFLPVITTRETSVPLTSVFVLETTNTDKMEIITLTGGEKVDPIIKNTYRLRFLNGLGGKKDHFRQCAAVAAQASVHQVLRPSKGFLLHELMDMLEETFS